MRADDGAKGGAVAKVDVPLLREGSKGPVGPAARASAARRGKGAAQPAQRRPPVELVAGASCSDITVAMATRMRGVAGPADMA